MGIEEAVGSPNVSTWGQLLQGRSLGAEQSPQSELTVRKNEKSRSGNQRAAGAGEMVHTKVLGMPHAFEAILTLMNFITVYYSSK